MPHDLDDIRVYTELSDYLDSCTKDIIPGRHPWCTRTDARRWLSACYADACQRTADDCGVSVAAIRKRGPGVSPFFSGVAVAFSDEPRPRKLNVGRVPVSRRSGGAS